MRYASAARSAAAVRSGSHTARGRRASSEARRRDTFEAIGRTLKKSPGPCPVYLTVRDPVGRAAQFKLSFEHFVDPAAVRVEELEMLLGAGKVLFSGR